MPLSEQVFSKLYSQYYGTLYSFLVNIVHDATMAEDIVQDVFLKFWLSMDKFQIDNYKAYLFIMARNKAITHIRREQQQRSINKLLQRSHVNGCNFTEEIVRQKETEVLLQKAILHLSPQRRKVYVLGQMEGLSRGQISKLLGISPCTVKELMRVSMQQIREYIDLHVNNTQPKPKAKPKPKPKRSKLPSMDALQAA